MRLTLNLELGNHRITDITGHDADGQISNPHHRKRTKSHHRAIVLFGFLNAVLHGRDELDETHHSGNKHQQPQPLANIIPSNGHHAFIAIADVVGIGNLREPVVCREQRGRIVQRNQTDTYPSA